MLFKKKNQKIINIEKITNEQDSRKIKKALEDLVDIEKTKVNIKKKQAIVTYNNTIDEELIQKTINNLGYIVTGINQKN